MFAQTSIICYQCVFTVGNTSSLQLHMHESRGNFSYQIELSQNQFIWSGFQLSGNLFCMLQCNHLTQLLIIYKLLILFLWACQQWFLSNPSEVNQQNLRQVLIQPKNPFSFSLLSNWCHIQDHSLILGDKSLSQKQTYQSAIFTWNLLCI